MAAPVLSGPILQFFRENCKLIRTLLQTVNISEFNTSVILDKLEGNQKVIARRLFTRQEIASWEGGYEMRGFHREDRVLRPVFVDKTAAEIADIDHVLEYLMVDAGRNINVEDPINRAAQPPNTPQNRQERIHMRAEVMGQLVDCPIPQALPANIAQIWSLLSPIFQDPDAFNAQGGISSMDDFYDYFWSQPWATMRHFNCLVRMLLFKNVAVSGGGGFNYVLGFSEEDVQQLLNFLQIPPEYYPIVIDSQGQGYTHSVRTRAEKNAILRRLPMLAGLFDTFNSYPIRLDITTVPFPIRHFKALMMLIKGQDLALQIPEVRLQTERNGHQLPERNWFFSARPQQTRQGPILNYQTPHGQENLNALERLLGIPRNNYWSYFNPSWRTHAQCELRIAEEQRRTRRGYGRRAERRIRNRNNNWPGPNYNQWNERAYENTNNNASVPNYNATRGRRLTRRELERLNRDPWESNNEGGGYKKTRRNRK